MEEKVEFQTAKLWKASIKLMRQIAAETGERMCAVVHRLLVAEHQRITQSGTPSKS